MTRTKCLWPLFYFGVACAKGLETRIKVSMNSPLKINVVDRKLQVWKWVCCDQKLVLNYDPVLSLKVVGLQICQKEPLFSLELKLCFWMLLQILGKAGRHDEIAHLKFKKNMARKRWAVLKYRPTKKKIKNIRQIRHKINSGNNIIPVYCFTLVSVILWEGSWEQLNMFLTIETKLSIHVSQDQWFEHFKISDST